MKVKFDGWKYLALADYSGLWYPFWDHTQGKASIELKNKIGPMEVGKEYDIEDDRIYFQNCGTGFRIGDSNSMTPCSGLWPNPSCGVCGGLGLGATFG